MLDDPPGEGVPAHRRRELRRAQFEGGDYERTAATEVPYLLASGVRLADMASEHCISLFDPGAVLT